MKYSLLHLFSMFCMLVIVDHVNSSNILVISFLSSKSHKLTYLPLIEELGKRGHNITIVSPVKPMKEMKNIKEIYTYDVEKSFQGDHYNVFDMKEKGTTVAPTVWVEMALEACRNSYDLPQVKALLNEKFDLVFMQVMFNECIFGLIHRLEVPFVMFTPTVIPPFYAGKVGGHFPSSITPNILLGYKAEMTFSQRFLNFGMDTMVTLFMNYAYEYKAERIYREKLGSDIPSISEIYENASMVMSNGHFSLSGPKPYYPDVVDVGGIHSRPAKPIPNDLEDFISQGNDGFILFSMGSVAKGDMMPEAKRKAILNVFSRLKQQVLWKWESESMPDLPKNVKLSKWLPQQDLLGHKDIKMFITHCGGGSTEESIYHGVPLVGIPMIADQPQNARLAKQNGFLVELSWNDLTEENLEEAINEILINPVYRDNVKRLSTLYKDRPQDPLSVGIYWIEYILRHRGAPHLRNAGRKLNVFQYHSIDVIATYLAIIATALYILYLAFRFAYRKLFCQKKFNYLEKKKKIL